MSLTKPDQERLEKILEECRGFDWEIEEGDYHGIDSFADGISFTHTVCLPWINVYIPRDSGEGFDWAMHVLGLIIRAYLLKEDEKERACVRISSDTPNELRQFVLDNSDPLESFTPADRKVNQALTVDGLPCEAPWKNEFGSCLVKIYAMKRNVASGGVLFGIGDEDTAYAGELEWVTADKFYTEWPQ